MHYRVILKSLKSENEVIVLDSSEHREIAQMLRKQWRRALGTRWTVDRRPGLDTLDHLALTVEKVP